MDRPAASGYRANLWLRIATRVLARVGEVEAREFGKLRRRAERLPWRRFVPPGAAIAVRASASRCRLYHTGALAETAVLAVADAVPGVRAARDDEDADVTFWSAAWRRFIFSADASGERLHRRGARVETGARAAARDAGGRAAGAGRLDAGRGARAIRCAARAPSSSRRRCRRWAARRGASAPSPSRAGRCWPSRGAARGAAREARAGARAPAAPGRADHRLRSRSAPIRAPAATPSGAASRRT